MTGAPVFAPRRVSVIRALWRSRVWIAVLLFAFLSWSLTDTSFVPTEAKVLASIGAIAIMVWRGPMALAMWRAANRGEVRQAKVTGRNDTMISSNGVGLQRLTWVDASGVAGVSRLAQPDTLPPNGTRIIVYVDPATGC